MIGQSPTLSKRRLSNFKAFHSLIISIPTQPNWIHPTPMSAPSAARTFVRYAKASSKANSQFLITLYVKPGVSRMREGIAAVSDSHVFMNVANYAFEGSANKSVQVLLAKTLSVPKSHVSIVKGLTSREKVAEVKLFVNETPENKVAWLMSMLERAVMPGKKVDSRGDGL
ncbi:hypothetical protein HBH64_006480 [Parastagonospora nodorum]|nr:hypothetical protein HBI10_014810 [Parastagonospora nodorum]KAH4025698.1 hypothetical protein HBI13_068730 [Parastagonospora nodorum]KAH4313110.1 hypothetical protein HBI01_004030 [Parastagonospora nodorum]KAH4316539.1 hypothetical protein HBI02_041630 [Parastagonospora nodorum]KAH4332249.1 hypothetical protein HBI00_056080 [Parastagonospora nodorum]